MIVSDVDVTTSAFSPERGGPVAMFFRVRGSRLDSIPATSEPEERRNGDIGEVLYIDFSASLPMEGAERFGTRAEVGI